MRWLSFPKQQKFFASMFLVLKNTFSRTFAEDSQLNSVPTMLLSFMQMVLDGPGITGRPYSWIQSNRKALVWTVYLVMSVLSETVKHTYCNLHRNEDLCCHKKRVNHQQSPWTWSVHFIWSTQDFDSRHCQLHHSSLWITMSCVTGASKSKKRGILNICPQ